MPSAEAKPGSAAWRSVPGTPLAAQKPLPAGQNGPNDHERQEIFAFPTDFRQDFIERMGNLMIPLSACRNSSANGRSRRVSGS